MFCLKDFIWGKSNCFAAWFQYISIVLNLAYYENKQIKNLGYWPRNILDFGLLEKGLGIVSPLHFAHDFSRKVFVMSYCINWPNFIIWSPLILEILGNMCIATVFFRGCDVINFEINFYLSNQAVILHAQKLKTKISISWERKELLRWNKKHFSSFLNSFQLLKIVTNLWVPL